jgi:hypothetical protein
MAAKSNASKPPMSAVNNVITKISERKPSVQDHTNDHKTLGGGFISQIGNGFKRFSNQRSI